MAFVLLSWCRVTLSLGIQIQAVFHMDGLRLSAIHAEVQTQLFFVVSTPCRDKTQQGFLSWSAEKRIFEGMQKQALLSGSQSGRGLSGVNMGGGMGGWGDGGMRGWSGEADHFFIFCKVCSTLCVCIPYKEGSYIIEISPPSSITLYLLADLKHKGNQFI